MEPGTYRHYKGNRYEVLGVARHSETEERLVVYRALYGEGGLWVRPLAMFEECVVVDGREVPRFRRPNDACPGAAEPGRARGDEGEKESRMTGVDERAAWERLARLLDDDEHLWPRVREALETGDPDPGEAVLDGLDDAGALACLDVDDTGMELADALAQLPRVFRLHLDLGDVSDTDDLGAAMTAADTVLAEAGFRLVVLPDADEDAYSLVVVPQAAVPEITKVSADLKLPITTFG